MGIVLGIDIGGSTTKIVGMNGNVTAGMAQVKVKATDPKSLLYNEIDGFLSNHKLKHSDVAAIYLTGVGSSFIDEQIFDRKTLKVPEFEAIGTGALRISGLKEALVVSMGTGTAFVRASHGKNVHIGGTGAGGGTVLGLTSHLPGGGDIDTILALAEHGDLRNVDLMVGDIMNHDLDTLPADMTAANFGKLEDSASDADFALGAINMVLEVIGVMALFALRNDTIKDIILTGTLVTFPQVKQVFGNFSKLTDKNFIIKPEAVFATALGALPY